MIYQLIKWPVSFLSLSNCRACNSNKLTPLISNEPKRVPWPPAINKTANSPFRIASMPFCSYFAPSWSVNSVLRWYFTSETDDTSEIDWRLTYKSWNNCWILSKSNSFTFDSNFSFSLLLINFSYSLKCSWLYFFNWFWSNILTLLVINSICIHTLIIW